jgi:hypothetical protein
VQRIVTTPLTLCCARCSRRATLKSAQGEFAAVPESIAIFAAIVSAIAGVYSAVAAARSAASAQATQQAAAESERRVLFRLISAAAADVEAEHRLAGTCASDLLSGYQTLGVRSGSFQHSGIAERDAKVRERLASVVGDVEHALSFLHGALVLQHAPTEDVERVHIRVATTLARVRSLREAFDRERASLEPQLTGRA